MIGHMVRELTVARALAAMACLVLASCDSDIVLYTDVGTATSPRPGRAGYGGGVCTPALSLLGLPYTSLVGSGTAGSCTEAALREAVEKGGHIGFRCGRAPVTIEVTAPLQVRSETSIDGANSVRISGAKRSAVFILASLQKLRLERLEILNGVTSTPDSGGALSCDKGGTIEALDVTFRDNENISNDPKFARSAGGVSARDSNVVFENCQFVGNRGGVGAAVGGNYANITVSNSSFIANITDDTGAGAGVFVTGMREGKGSLRICGSLFSGNVARQGGAVYTCGFADDQVEIDRSAFIENAATSQGGAIWSGCNGRTIIRDVSAVKNFAEGYGGALWLQGPYPVVQNTTIANNYTKREGGVGGGIFVEGEGVTLRSVTLAQNQAFYSGAIFHKSATASACLITGNKATNPYGVMHGCNAKFALGSENYVFPATVLSADPNNQPCDAVEYGIDPGVAEVRWNGGPTPTLRVGRGSPAAGSVRECLAVDQGGQPRASPCTAGAWEAR